VNNTAGLNTSDCNPPVTSAMSNQSGAALYYGTKAATGSYQDYVPESNGFPFSQIQYTNDNTGRIARKGGVGSNHQIGSTHEMIYIYTTPEEFELERLFGNDVGNLEHYKKNIVSDPNGQFSVSYIDPQGRTIATALMGDAPAKENNNEILSPLADEANLDLHKVVKTNILRNDQKFSTGNLESLVDGFRIRKEIVGPKEVNSLKLVYDITPPTPFVPNGCSSVDVDYPYAYKLQITAVNDCGQSILASEIDHDVVVDKTGLDNAFTFGELSNYPINISNLPKGVYTVNRSLTLNNKKVQEYADQYVASLQDENSTCYQNPSAFLPEASLDVCALDCESCTRELGPEVDYVISELVIFLLQMGQEKPM